MFIYIYIILLLIVAGVSKAVMDTVVHHFHISIFRKLDHLFWNPDISWRYKYKGGLPENGPRFFLSTTVLVWLTDAWHLFQLIFLFALTKAFLLIGTLSNDYWFLIISFSIGSILYKSIFELFYRKIFV